MKPETASNEFEIKKAIAKSLKIDVKDINCIRIIRKSVDARKSPVYLNLTFRVATNETKVIDPFIKKIKFEIVPGDAPRLIIVGAGPAGLFAALEAIKNGIRPIVLERGTDVDSRRIDIANISRYGRINPHSNYCFGEGGAGAFSDGKLFTRSKKRGSVEEVLQLLVQHGASEKILIESHPHIGSDKLPQVIKNIRETIIQCGGEVHFNTKVDSLLIDTDHVSGIVANNKIVEGDGIIIATGHSAHDTFRKLHEQNVSMEAKGIAIGVRLEHPQELIDKIQYKSSEGRGKYLPPAEYSFVAQSQGRGVYSFCMCPGGVIVPAGSSDQELVVNGMSASSRSGKWANSGMVVEIRPGDFPYSEEGNPLEMLQLQEKLERLFFEYSGNSIIAPAQRMIDFVENKISKTLPASSYAPGLLAVDFNQLLPKFISRRLKDGFINFGRKAKGFLTNEAVMIGLESRTSSPIRITRDQETLESVSLKRLYPSGEGAGYAGGIVSAAIDGMRCAKAFALKYSAGKLVKE